MIESAYILWTVLGFTVMMFSILIGSRIGIIPFIFPLMGMVFFAVAGAGAVNIHKPFAVLNMTNNTGTDIVTGDIIHTSSWQLWLLHGALVFINFLMLFKEFGERLFRQFEGGGVDV